MATLITKKNLKKFDDAVKDLDKQQKEWKKHLADSEKYLGNAIGKRYTSDYTQGVRCGTYLNKLLRIVDDANKDLAKLVADCKTLSQRSNKAANKK